MLQLTQLQSTLCPTNSSLANSFGYSSSDSRSSSPPSWPAPMVPPPLKVTSPIPERHSRSWPYLVHYRGTHSHRILRCCICSPSDYWWQPTFDLFPHWFRQCTFPCHQQDPNDQDLHQSNPLRVQCLLRGDRAHQVLSPLPGLARLPSRRSNSSRDRLCTGLQYPHCPALPQEFKELACPRSQCAQSLQRQDHHPSPCSFQRIRHGPQCKALWPHGLHCKKSCPPQPRGQSSLRQIPLNSRTVPQPALSYIFVLYLLLRCSSSSHAGMSVQRYVWNVTVGRPEDRAAKDRVTLLTKIQKRSILSLPISCEN